MSAINIAIFFTFHLSLECGGTDKEINSKDAFHINFHTKTDDDKCIFWMFFFPTAGEATVSCFRMMECVDIHFFICVQLIITPYISCSTECYKSKL